MDHQAAGWPRGSLLAQFPQTARDDVLSRGTLVELPAGTRFLHQGEHKTEVFLLVEGLVKVTADTADGDSMLLAIRVAGDAVGELAGVDGLPRVANVTAAGLVRARRISGLQFEDFLEGNPRAAVAVTRSVSAKLRWATHRRIDFGAYPVVVRLSRILVDLASRHGFAASGGLDVGVELSQPELAALIGAAEPSVHRALRELRGLGLLATGYRRLTIVDLERLSTFARLGSDDEIA